MWIVARFRAERKPVIIFYMTSLTLNIDDSTRLALDRVAARERLDPAEEGTRLLRRALLFADTEPFLTLARVEALGDAPGAPDGDTRDTSVRTLARFYAAIQAGNRRWYSPNITAGAMGEVVCEWWHGARKLTAYIPASGDFEYVRVWGADLGSEMDDGTARTNDEYLTLWDWLTNDAPV
jgi:hypothetical protein